MAAWTVDPTTVLALGALPHPRLVQDSIQQGGNRSYAVIVVHPLSWPIILCERRPWHALPYALRWREVKDGRASS